MILSLILALIVFFLFLELYRNQLHIQEYLFPLRLVRVEVFLVCYSLAQARVDTVQDDVGNIIDCYLGMNM